MTSSLSLSLSVEIISSSLTVLPMHLNDCVHLCVNTLQRRQTVTAACGCARWSELTRKLELWIEIHELSEQGEYVPVEVSPRPEVPSGGVFQLRQVTTCFTQLHNLHSAVSASVISTDRYYQHQLLARDVIYTSRTYATMSMSVCL